MPSYTVRLFLAHAVDAEPINVRVEAPSLADALVAAHRLHPGAELIAAEAVDGRPSALPEAVAGEATRSPVEVAESVWATIDLGHHFQDINAGDWQITRAATSTIVRRYMEAAQPDGTEFELEFVVWVNDTDTPRLREAYLVDVHSSHRLLGVGSDGLREDAHALAERAFSNVDFAEDHGEVVGEDGFESISDGLATTLTKVVYVQPRHHSDFPEPCSQRVHFEVRVDRGLVTRIEVSGG